jgi:protein O-GlcNAc transferase
MNPQALLLLNQALQYLRNNNPNSAALLVKQALKLDPKNVDALRLFGVVLAQKHQHIEALNYFQKALKLDPKNGLVFSNIGNTLQELKRYEEALVAYDQAISLLPNYAEAYSNRGNALHELKRYQQALLSHRQAIAIEPNYAEAYSNLGNTLRELKRYDESLAASDIATKIRPNYAEAWCNKGNTFGELKRYEEALVAFKTAITLKRDCDYSLGNLIHTKMLLGDWTGLDNEIEQLTKKINLGENVMSPFGLLSAVDSPALHLKCSKNWINHNHPQTSLFPNKINTKHQKIRIGYFSADFKSHPVAFLTAELFELHNRDSFEVFAFSLQGANPEDKTRARLLTSFDQFFDVEEKTDLEIAHLSQSLNIDIAIDLGGHTTFSRTSIFAHKAAPIQINYLGYPGSIGAEYFDYIVADRAVIPEENQMHYSEKIIYLPNSYMVDDSSRVMSNKKFTREEFNLPSNKTVFCCFNNSYKFNLEVLRSWANILLKATNSVLWISENNQSFKKNLLIEFQKFGVDDNRIIFANRMNAMEDHLNRCQLADLFLDTFPYNAHTTAIDALKSSLPILTLSGESFPSRVTESLLQTIELPELITRSWVEYESLAIELALNPDKLKKIKAKLIENCKSTPLFNTRLYTKHLEEAYLKAFHLYQEGLNPTHIFV